MNDYSPTSATTIVLSGPRSEQLMQLNVAQANIRVSMPWRDIEIGGYESHDELLASMPGNCVISERVKNQVLPHIRLGPRCTLPVYAMSTSDLVLHTGGHDALRKLQGTDTPMIYPLIGRVGRSQCEPEIGFSVMKRICQEEDFPYDTWLRLAMTPIKCKNNKGEEEYSVLLMDRDPKGVFCLGLFPAGKGEFWHPNWRVVTR